tara:strand:+ start:235 stop:552 length:318 start_codon:yes stop_codon:yes gene_type:complete
MKIDWEKAERTVLEAFEVPTEWLPESYRGVRETRNLWSVEKQRRRQEAKQNRTSEKKAVKQRRLDRVAKYAKQYEAEGQFDYDVDEKRLYDAQVRFVKYSKLEDE